MLTATITGRDDVSLRVLKAYDDGVKVKNIPNMFPVTIDQAKILSRYRRMLEQSRGHIIETNYQTLVGLGIKCLRLAPLFKMKDWEGMNDVLSVISPETKREEISMYMEALKEKRKRLFKLQQEVNDRREELTQKELSLKQFEKDLAVLNQTIDETLYFLKKYPKNVREFLGEHLGLYQNEIVLAKRLDYRWQKGLKEKDILRYDEELMVHFVINLDALAENLEFRIQRGYAIHYDYEKAEKMIGGAWRVSTSANYALPTGLAENLQQEKEQIKEQMKTVKAERKQVEQELKNLRNAKPSSFIESIEARNILSLKELERHGQLQHEGMKWLLMNDYVAISEFRLPNKKIVDVIGYSKKGRVVVIEAKSTWEDWKSDQKWQGYMEYCDEFYFLVYPEVYQKYLMAKDEFWNRVEGNHKAIGILVWDGKNLTLRKESEGHMKVKHPTELLFEIAKESTKKYIFGH